MLRRRFTRALLLVLPALSAVALAGVVQAQCLITGPTEVCAGGSVTLCGPSGYDQYDWTLPDGTRASTQCITATTPGTYALSVYDAFDDLWFGPCAQTVAAMSSGLALPVITGSTSGCTGTSLSLCGPTGTFDYAWSGPGGFTATTACVDVSAAGSYRLTVRVPPDGCWSDTATTGVTFTACGTPMLNCPRPAWWWEAQCTHRAEGLPSLTDDQVRSVADCVSGRDASLSAAAVTFCSAVRDDPHSLRMRAIRQIGAVWSNVCAGQLGIVPAGGSPIALDPGTTLTLARTGGSVADWLARADATLASLASAPQRNRSTIEAYRELIRVGWCINHGMGIGATCATHGHETSQALVSGTTSLSGSVALSADGTTLPLDSQEPLSVQLLEDSGGPLAFGSLEPNPFTSATRLAFAVTSTAPAEVTIGVYDISGRLVRELVRGAFATGQYETRWDGNSTDGSPARSGMYFILGRVEGHQVQTRVTFVH